MSENIPARVLLEQSPDAVFVVEPEDASILKVNRIVPERLGWSREEILNRTYIDIDRSIHDSDSWKALANRIRDEGPIKFEGLHERQNGDRFPVELHARSVAIDGKNRLLLMARVITRRNEVRRRLRESRRRFQELAQHTDDVIWMFNHDWSELLYTNKAYEWVFGRSVEDVYVDPMDFMNAVHPEDRDSVRSAMETLSGGQPAEVEFRVNEQENYSRWVWVKGRPVFDRDGEVIRVTGLARDITERKMIQRSVRETRRRLSTLLGNLPGMAYRCANEPDWPLEFVSEGCRELTGYDPSTLERGEVTWGEDVIHPEDQARVWHEVQQSLERREPFKLTYRIYRRDGARRWVWEQGQGVFGENGQLEALEGFITDVTEREQMEQKLQRLTERYRSLFEHSPIALIEEDFSEVEEIFRDISSRGVEDLEPHLREHPVLLDRCLGSIELKDANQAAVELFGASSKSELLEHTVNDFIPEDHRDDMIRELGAMWEGKSLIDLKSKNRRLNGDMFYLEGRLTFVNGSKNWDRVLFAFTDSTERVEAEQKLRESEERFRQMAENIDEVFWLTTDELDVLYVSPSCENVLGIPDEILEDGMEPWRDLIHPDDRDRIWRSLTNWDMEDELEAEYRIEASGGTIRWIRNRWFPIRDEKGEPYRVVGISRDITRRKITRQQLKQSERQFREAFEGAPIPIMIHAEDGEILRLNRCWTERSGYPKEDIPTVEDWVRKAYRGPKRSEVMEHIHQEYELSEAKNYGEITVHTSQGEQRVWDVSVAPLPPLSDGRKRVMVMPVDVTEQTRYEDRLARSLQEKETLLKEVHHRVRNNLQVVSSMLGLQARKTDQSRQRKILLDSRNRIHAMAMIHEKLYQSENLAEVELSRYVRELVDQLLVNRQKPDRSIEVQYDLDDLDLDLNAMIPCGLIINELVSNALEHAFPDRDQGHIEIRIHKSSGDRATIVVSDDGIGFHETLDETNTLGLTLVQNLVEHQLEGSIEIEREGGTTFRIMFPRSE